MGTMNRMRENTGIILWILVLSFGVIWVLQDSGVFDTLGTDPLGKVIIVDGDVITREQYNQQLESQLEQIRQQTNSTVEPERLEMERERAFNALVTDRLLQHQMDKLGITVSEREIRDRIDGDTPHWVILSNFSNEDGELDRELLQSVIDAPEQQGTWLQIEEIIRQDRRREKYAETIFATVRVSDADIDEVLEQEEKTASANYFYLSYSDAPDSVVNLTDRDIERYYRDNSEDYERKRIYTVDIASMSKNPSAADTAQVLEDVGRMRGPFESATDDSLYLSNIGSESPWSDAFLGPAVMEDDLASALFEGDSPLEPGLVVGPVVAGSRVELAKVLETRDADGINVRARHILVRLTEGSSDEEESAAREKIDDILQRLNDGDNFADLAAEFSDDPSGQSSGGDLGWFGEGTMVDAFQDAAFEAAIGDVVGPIQTQFGLHLIETLSRSDIEVRLARLGFAMDASVATLNSLTEELEDLAYFGEETGDFVGEAEGRGISVQQMNVEDEQNNFPGLGMSRGLESFLEDAKEGDISPIIEFNDWAIIAHVVSIEKEGVRPLEDVESIVRPQALLEKKKAYQTDRMTEAYVSGGFDGLVQALGQQPSTVEDLRYSNPVISGLGRDLIFTGTVFGLDQGEDSGVMQGANAVFVVRTTGFASPTPLEEDARDSRVERILAQRENSLTSQMMIQLLEEAEIEDLRTDLLPQQN